ncbi:MAG TPA: ABC-2 transporter permease [Candidatus Lokiarchaeia archaeon]|nr:ABC-2 transporter permease [Candidatus Lokiarchaeia archaeon]
MTESNDENSSTESEARNTSLPARPPGSQRFSARRTLVVAKRVLRQIGRDKRTFGMLIGMPIVIMAIFGLALSGDVKNVPVLIDNSDRGYTAMIMPGVNKTFAFGANLTATLQADDRLQVSLGNYNDSKSGVDGGTYFAVIRIPANFSEALYQKILRHPPITTANVTIDVYLDGTKVTIKATILAALQDGLKTTMGNTTIVALNEQFAFGGVDFSGLNQALPSVMGFVLTMLVLIISMLILKRETVGGTEERLLTTPLKVSERLVGYTVALLVMAMIMVTAILLIGVGLFGAVVQGSWLLLILMLLLYALSNVFMAVFLANFAKNEIQAVQMAVLIALPSMALAGVFIPVISFPAFVQVIAKCIPLYYGVQIFEGVMLKGWGIAVLWPDMLALACFAVGFLILALVTVRNKLDA